MSTIFAIVEGHGEVDAFPVIARRVLQERLGIYDCSVQTPYRVPRSQICQFGEDLTRSIRFGESKIRSSGGQGGILVLADADDDCPAEMQAKFTEFLANFGAQFPISFVMANREYEAWFIACGEEMRDHQFVRNDAPSHPLPESIRGAKGYFEREILLEGKSYSETVDQAKFSAQISIDVVLEKCRSFRKFVNELTKLSTTLQE